MADFSKATGKSFRDRGGNCPPGNSSQGSLPCLMCVLGGVCCVAESIK